MYPTDLPGRAKSSSLPLLQVWIIINPTSGQGRGKQFLHRIEKALQMEFSHCITRVRDASEFFAAVDPKENRKSNDIAITTTTSSSSSPLQCVEQLDPAEETEVGHVTSCSRTLHVDIITTEEKIRGEEIAKHLSKMIVTRRLHHCIKNMPAPTYDVPAAAMEEIDEKHEEEKEEERSLHVFVAVGGDGSLSDVVNGICHGTLEAYRETLPDHMKGNNMSCKDDSQSKRYYWESLGDISVLRYFLPPLIYVPAGTGSDFAKLKLCCCGEEECINVLRGVWEKCLSSSSSPAAAVSAPMSPEKTLFTPDTMNHTTRAFAEEKESNIKEKRKNRSSGFEVYDVDIGRVSFPRSGNCCFFINECSCGMSCDVVQKCEEYKQSFISLLGGKIMFAIASIIALMQAKPKPFRFIVLPDFPSLPSKKLIMRRVASDLMHPHVLRSDVAFQGMQCDLQWVKKSAEMDALPATEPLRFGANYYVYNTKNVSESTLTNCSPAAEVEIATNSLYSHPSCKEAKTPNEIVAAINNTDDPARWICIHSSTLAFGNGRWFGGGLQVTPHASPTDGRISVTSWVAGFARFVFNALSLYSGKHTNWPSTTMWNAERIIVDVDTRTSSSGRYPSTADDNKATSRLETLMASCETDGELRESLPAVIEMCGVVTMLVPCRKRKETK